MTMPLIYNLEIIDVQTTKKVLFIDENDNFFGTDGYRSVFKATEKDLSDSQIVCVLPSNSMLKKLLFVSALKAVGYVQSSTTPEDEGFYCFDNADTATWTARRISKMDAGFPAFEFQSFIKCSTNNYLFAGSYGTKDTDPAPVNVYRSVDLGETWTKVYTHSVTANTHIHAVEFDPYRNRVWVCIGDEGLGGKPGWAYSDDYGDTWSFVENNDASGQLALMDTAIIPFKNFILTGSDFHPAGLRKWEGGNETVINTDVEDDYYLIPVETTGNLGFARNPVVKTDVVPYKIAIPFASAFSYSNPVLLISPDFKNWYIVESVSDPQNVLSWSALSGITSDGYVLGWCSLTGTQYHRYFKFPNWKKVTKEF